MNAPSVKPQDLDEAIAQVEYIVLPDGRTTICMLTLDNGFTVNGQSACVCAENFDAELGRKYSFEQAREKLWPLLGFRLADRLHAERQAAGPRYRDAVTGEYVTKDYALLNPATTVVEA